jgi:carbon storage regulator
MLVLTRRIGEVIRIGPHIVVTILGVNGSQVRVGVDAPRNVTVHREEVFERIKRAGNSGLPQDVATQARASAPEIAEGQSKSRR